MKRILILFVGALLSVSQLWAGDSLRETFSHRSKPVRVAVQEPVNRSEDTAFLSVDFKKALEEKLAARREPKFTVASDAAGVEILISAEVTECIFLEHDPVDKLIGLAGAAYDAATVEHYARLTAVFTVRDVKSGRTLWTDKLKATVTDKIMTRDESRSKVMARAAEIFIREAFGKKRR